ncbi:hypothetical protein EauS123_00009 [Exiguobacterium phage vB_EauS-123]|nr:hypothetical protein EauS123_00009 [Exiguobacterium phage vB_EauS-123]
MPRAVKQIYAAYHGDRFISVGTDEELAEELGKTSKTIRWYSTPTAHSRYDYDKSIRVYRIHDDGETEYSD